MGSEYIDVYDENMVYTDKKPRKEVHSLGLWHRSFHCWIVARPGGSGGYVLFQRRGPDKVIYPNALDITAAGHLSAGERPEDGVRELVEELGIRVSFDELVHLGLKFDIAKIDEMVNKEFCDVYLLRRDEPASSYRPDPSEVHGLFQLDVSLGLGLFSGRLSSADATGVEWDKAADKWTQRNIQVSVRDFIPRTDPYYYKIFIMAERLLEGKSDLAI